MEYGFDITQNRVKRLCNKLESNTDLLPLFWTSRHINFGQVEKKAQLVRGQARKILFFELLLSFQFPSRP